MRQWSSLCDRAGGYQNARLRTLGHWADGGRPLGWGRSATGLTALGLPAGEIDATSGRSTPDDELAQM